MLTVLAALGSCVTTERDEGSTMVNVRIDERIRYQILEGFGASGSWTMDPVGEYWSEENRRRLGDLLFSVNDGIGLSIWKFNAGASGLVSESEFFASPYAWRKAASFRPTDAGPYDWDAHAGQRWFLSHAQAHGVDSIQIIFYSPPSWMTKNRLTHPDASSGATNLLPEFEDAYVRYMVDVVEHLQSSAGPSISGVVPLNEPNWAWNDSNQEANRYGVEEIKRILTSLAAEMERRGVTASIIAPEAGEIMALLDDESFSEYWLGLKRRYNSQNLEMTTGGKFREYAEELLGDPEMNAILGNRISAHSYWSDSREPPDDRMVRLRRMVRDDIDEHAPDAVYLQTEYCILGDNGPGRDLTMASALHVAEVIHRDLTILNAAEWSWWLALSPHDYKDGLIYTDWQRPGDAETIYPSKILYVLGQYSRFIRPGYVRISAVTENPAEDAAGQIFVSAYSDAKTGQSVIVLTNPGAEEVVISLSDTAAFDIYRTSDSEDIAHVGIRGGDAPVHLPGSSVTTLVSLPE